MTANIGLALTAGAFVATASATLAVRGALLRRRVMDIPNERSSHNVPVPRGGGAAFVAVIAAGLSTATVVTGALPSRTLLAVAAVLGVAAIGLVDDARGVPARIRLAVHLACGLAATAVPALALADHAELGTFATWALAGAMAVAAAWTINMVNFMDGIDGIAAMEGVFVLGAAGALAASGGDATLAWTLAACGASVLGFLAVNLSPLRIFMGDCGSGALGLLVAWLLAEAVASGAIGAWTAVALPAAFTADAGVTLAVRVSRGERPAQAHRTHAYQRMVRKGAGHVRVTGAYALANLCAVLPVAWLAQRSPSAAPIAVIALHAALAAAAYAAGAGREPGQRPAA
jgi:Fuc2NAc and GlcNAc transferase